MLQNDCVAKMSVISILFVFCSTNGFNLSPKPNYSFREPKINNNFIMTKNQSSYFGFTINLRGTSVIVGAPRAQSAFKKQRNIYEPGAIYKCYIANGTCASLVFDYSGNIDYERNNYTFSQEAKDQQWLGASMDGGSQDSDKLVVCAPRLIANSTKDYLMHGICYWKADTVSNNPLDVKEITPLRLKYNQVIEREGTRHYIHMLGEQGLSVHVTSNNEEIIIGAPGIDEWKGSVIRYHPQRDDLNVEENIKRDVRQTQTKINFTTEVLNPKLWNQHSFSYFGYSVGSGYFNRDLPNKIYYVASAPQANYQSGAVYIFDIIKNPRGKSHTIKKLSSFNGTQFGEYFGYAVLAEDFNGDALTDLIITAPQYSSNGHVEQGAIYIFINKGNFVFELQKIIKSPIEGIGRFGTSISKLGDINRDGFNDIAVGAPFAGNGTVFIYLGSSKGLREVHSQQLLSPGSIANSWGQHVMFGHGLSKGCDIDNNGLNDLAIGAPNAESVFVYRAYPVVKIHATINSLKREIKSEEKHFKIEICYMISTKLDKIKSQRIYMQVIVDRKVKRITFEKTYSNELRLDVAAKTYNQCELLDANINFRMADIFKPIELEIHYDLIDGVPNSEEFCDRCAAVDPADPKVSVEKIIFTTGCSGICIADLKVTSFPLSRTYILGSGMPFSVTYEVTNSGETAYFPQINITSSNKMPFKKIPPSCDQYEDYLVCDLNPGQPMFKNGKENITIDYDIRQIEGTHINLTAVVLSAGQEQNPSDNVISDFISLQEFAEIEAIGKTNEMNIDLEKVFNSIEIINNYEIKSNGPSTIEELEIVLEIPVAQKLYGSIQPVSVIDVNNITVQGRYNYSQHLFVELYQNERLLQANLTESEAPRIVIQNENEPSSQPLVMKLGEYSDELSTADVLKKDNSSEEVAPNNELLASLPADRTIVFSCSDTETTTCVRAIMKVQNFIPNTPINITLKFHVNLNEINKILKRPWEFFVIVPKLNIVKVPELDENPLNITRKIEYNVILKHHTDIPLMEIILAILGGILVLVTIAYSMHKAGFFRRKTMEEIKRIVQEQQEAAEWREEINKQIHNHNRQEANDTEDL